LGFFLFHPQCYGVVFLPFYLIFFLPLRLPLAFRPLLFFAFRPPPLFSLKVPLDHRCRPPFLLNLSSFYAIPFFFSPLPPFPMTAGSFSFHADPAVSCFLFVCPGPVPPNHQFGLKRQSKRTTCLCLFFLLIAPFPGECRTENLMVGWRLSTVVCVVLLAIHLHTLAPPVATSLSQL